MREVITTVRRYTATDGIVGWSARSEIRQPATVVFGDSCNQCESLVIPDLRSARVDGCGTVDFGEPWPDPTTPVGLERLMAIAERLAVTEWERRFGGVQ